LPLRQSGLPARREARRPVKSSPVVFAHAVRADLPNGPAFQPCPCAETAAALFDRLRLRFPGLGLQRLQNGRVVEIARVDPGAG